MFHNLEDIPKITSAKEDGRKCLSGGLEEDCDLGTQKVNCAGASSLTTASDALPDMGHSLHLNPGTLASCVLALLTFLLLSYWLNVAQASTKPEPPAQTEWPLESLAVRNTTLGWCLGDGWRQEQEYLLIHREEHFLCSPSIYAAVPSLTIQFTSRSYLLTPFIPCF